MTGWWWWLASATILLSTIPAQASEPDCIETLVKLSSVKYSMQNTTISILRDNEIDQPVIYELDNFQDANFLLKEVGIKSIVDRIKIFKCFKRNEESLCHHQHPCGVGLCVLHDDQYTCQCQVGFSGPNCGTDIDECASQPCLHGGTCVDHINNFTCLCPDGWFGRRCEADFNECASQPCSHGSCMDIVNGYECECHPGYTGLLCEEDIKECLSSPCHHGKCRDHVGKYSCHCHRGYEGTNCDVDIDDCASGPCQNKGTCQDHVNNYTCHCAVGYDGRHCENLWLTKDSFTTMDLKLESSLKTSKNVAYIRWGRSECPATATLVYSGIAGGAHYSHAGGGVDTLCMPDIPIYGRHADYAHGDIIYGGDYATQGQNAPYSSSLNGKKIPCVLCLANNVSSSTMIPARNVCPSGWRLEYHGYLQASRYNAQPRSRYLCFDDESEASTVSGGTGHSLYRVGVIGFGSPYVGNRELTCAVCTM